MPRLRAAFPAGAVADGRRSRMPSATGVGHPEAPGWLRARRDRMGIQAQGLIRAAGLGRRVAAIAHAASTCAGNRHCTFRGAHCDRYATRRALPPLGQGRGLSKRGQRVCQSVRASNRRERLLSHERGFTHAHIPIRAAVCDGGVVGKSHHRRRRHRFFGFFTDYRGVDEAQRQRCVSCCWVKPSRCRRLPLDTNERWVRDLPILDAAADALHAGHVRERRLEGLVVVAAAIGERELAHAADGRSLGRRALVS